MIKLLGTIFILFSCIAFSLNKIKTSVSSLTALRALINSLKEMADHISCRKMPLPEILSLLAERKDDIFFKKVISCLETDKSFSHAWEKALTEDILLPEDAKKTLYVLGRNLGSRDAYQENEDIRFCISELENIYKEQEKATQKNSKMLKSFGVLSGLLIVIMFI